jgi:hypothetical protein
MKQVERASQLDNRIREYKIAALEKTLAFPLNPWLQLGDPRRVLAPVFAIVGQAVNLPLAKRAAA